MPLYAILLNEPNESAWDKVRETWPKHYVFDNRLALISTENVLTADVARDAGIGADGVSGIVMQMDFYSGHTSSTLVEWISKNRD